ncbi:hypothetical protein DA075_19235 [Methylobacterium currus]|uniref:Gp5/Type VI secretion system Vgr protein OB-fold domain-containing protein n=1 Tax=Methylobacterium currus TaxID=2051553 RepID=A0A2R4WMK0_9HYPH|nr:phage baseplate assembly protein V [Methylobacterium currus]AWB22777.1 hypothetical protein DA075_19235 [Methylobacterium currus]UHC17630.1 phage baseplate assembly protein V [Methylobacterium currus]
MSQSVRQLAGVADGPLPDEFAIAPGVVTNNVDMIAEGRVQVHIASAPGIDPWARLSSVGGGSGRGFYWVPQLHDEVLVAFAQNDPNSAYVLGGLWSTLCRPPSLVPVEAPTKRVIKTGVAAGIGHEIEFDDALQSISITTSTMQKVTLDPLAITLSNLAGTLKISLDNTTQSISIQAVNSIDLKATEISLTGASVAIKAGSVSVTSAGPCTVTGLPIKLN